VTGVFIVLTGIMICLCLDANVDRLIEALRKEEDDGDERSHHEDEDGEDRPSREAERSAARQIDWG
jgi:hypothetical protein